jgi:hypothetical protein
MTGLAGLVNQGCHGTASPMRQIAAQREDRNPRSRTALLKRVVANQTLDISTLKKAKDS